MVYLLEVIYNKVEVENNGTEGMRQYVRVATHVMRFEDPNKSVALQNANREMDRVLRYGLKMSGGAVIKSVITPAAILQVGIVDHEKWSEEMAMDQDVTEVSEETGTTD